MGAKFTGGTVPGGAGVRPGSYDDESPATPAPLDPSKVKAGDTVQVHVVEGRNEYDVHGKVWEPGMEAPAGLSVGNVSLTAPNVTLTAHQPAPEPEPEGRMSRANVLAAIEDRLGETGSTDPEANAYVATNVVMDLLTGLVVIDPAKVDENELASIIAGEYGHEDDVARALDAVRVILAELGIEAP